MNLTVLATCNGGDCPTVYVDESGLDLVVQGVPVASGLADVSVPPGESLVRIPRSVLLEAAARLSAGS